MSGGELALSVLSDGWHLPSPSSYWTFPQEPVTIVPDLSNRICVSQNS